MLLSKAIESLVYYKTDEPYYSFGCFSFSQDPCPYVCPSTMYVDDFEVETVKLKINPMETHGFRSTILPYTFFVFGKNIAYLNDNEVYLLLEDGVVKSNNGLNSRMKYETVSITVEEVK